MITESNFSLAGLGLPTERELETLAGSLFAGFDAGTCAQGIERLATSGDTGVIDRASQKATVAAAALAGAGSYSAPSFAEPATFSPTIAPAATVPAGAGAFAPDSAFSPTVAPSAQSPALGGYNYNTALSVQDYETVVTELAAELAASSGAVSAVTAPLSDGAAASAPAIPADTPSLLAAVTAGFGSPAVAPDAQSLLPLASVASGSPTVGADERSLVAQTAGAASQPTVASGTPSVLAPAPSTAPDVNRGAEQKSSYAPTVLSQAQADEKTAHGTASPVAHSAPTGRTAQNTAPAADDERVSPTSAHTVIGTKTLGQIRADFPILFERINGNQLVWLDNGATTQRPRQVIDRLVHFYEHENSNVHRGVHELADRSTDAMEKARQTVADFIGAPSTENIVFVRGTTEAINLVAASYVKQYLKPGDEIIVTLLEHHANIVPWQLVAQETGAVIKVAPIDASGQIILSEYEKLFTPRTRFASATQVSNALGTCSAGTKSTVPRAWA